MIASPPRYTVEALRSKIAQPTFTATDKQEEFLKAVLSGEYLYLAMGGGIRGTKTWGILSVLIVLCRIFPGSRWAIVRKDLPTLRRNTVPSINKIRLLAAGFVGELKQDTWTYTCENGSQILLFPESFSTDPDLDRWKGLEVNGFALEEANEMMEASANKAIERAGSWIIPPTRRYPNPVQPPPFVLFTFNPCDNWPRRWFYEPYHSGLLKAPYYYLPSTAADNPYIPDAVREAWKNLPEADYNRFVEGSWDFAADPDQLIPLQWIWAARGATPKLGPNRMGVDPAWMGNDECTFCRVRGNHFVDIKAFGKTRIPWIAKTVMLTANMKEFPINAEDVRIDTVGVGAGVGDICFEELFYITPIVAGSTQFWERPTDEGSESFYKFRNLRSQLWWEAREKFRLAYEEPDNPKGCSLPENVPEKLIADLSAMKYKITSDRVIEVLSKDKAREIIGRSTDYGDAYITAIADPPPPSFVSFGSARM